MNHRYPTLLADGLILLACILAILAVNKATYSQGSGYLQVQTHDATYRYSLSTNRDIHVDGPLGDTYIVIKDGQARIVDSACPTKSCTFQKPISTARSWIACLPNQVLLTVVGPSDTTAEVDDVAN
ncbi:MAG: NusG domain II-containing protein [Sphaerochaeta sp.]